MSRKAINLIVVFGFSFFFFPPLSQAQVTLTVNNGSGYRGSHNNPVEVSLSNPGDRVKRVQMDVCDVDDYLSGLDCTVTDRGRDGFACQVLELPNPPYCARVVLSSPGGLIEQGTGDIFTLKYNVDTGAPGGQSRALDPVNVFVTDEFDSNLTITPPPGSGLFTFENCSTGTQCEDGLFCNGTEGCSGGVCTHTGDPCPGSECDTCQEDTDSCFDPEGTPCNDDDLYCTADVCDGAGTCVPTSPCPNATCVEIDDQCTCNLPGESCEDGNFCNGGDFCLFGVCEHTGDPCPSQGLHCDTLLGRCSCLIDAECDDANSCTDDSCAADRSCRYLDNTDPCDDGIYCNGADTCGCGTCNHSGDPCSGIQVCDEDADFCSSSEVEVLMGIGTGVIGSIDRQVNVQLKNPSRFVKAMDLEVCDENDYLIATSCVVSTSFDPVFSCAVNELENGCAQVVLTPEGLNPQPILPSSSYQTILNIGYDVGLCVQRGTPGDVNDCGTECFQAGSSCSASSPDCYRFNRNKFPNCQPPPGFTCYVLDDPCLPIDSGDVWVTIEDALVLDNSDNPLRVLRSSAPFANFEISCDGDADCDKGSVCSIDTCSGGDCQHSPSGVTVCDDGVYCTETDRCSGTECIGEGETCGSIFLCNETDDQCISCFDDSDCDGVPDGSDNCLGTPNGPDGGVCTAGASGEPCLENCDCALSNGYCSLTQEDSYPPVGNNRGDACDCEGNFDCDTDVDGSDAQKFKTDFGRSLFQNPCSNSSPCNGDFDCDVDVDGSDARVFKDDFGRSLFQNPCPVTCVIPPGPAPWCPSYP